MALNPDPATKVVYLARRNPRLSREEFPARWRQHSLLAGSCQSIRSGFAQVAQCINLYDRAIVPRANLDFDGVNLLSFVAPHYADAVWQQDEVHDLLLPDELQTFDTYVRYFSLTALEHVVSPGPMTPYCLIHFLKRDPRIDPAEFAEALAGAHGKVADGKRRAVVNLVTDRMPGYNFDAITEVWFADLDDARAFLADEAWAGRYMAAREAICADLRTVTMWTRINYARPPLDEPGS